MKNFKVYLIIILVCVISTLYIFEGYIRIISLNKISDIKDNTSLKEKIYKEKTGKQYDARTNLQVIEYYKKKGKNVILSFLPHNLRGSTDLDLFPLSGPSNSKIIYCNENGYYSIIDSDRYGFNNPDEEWEKEEIEYLIVGDSYAHGSCVNRPNDIASVLRTLSKKSVINLDGLMTEDVWKDVDVIDDYIQYSPYNMSAPTFKTETRMFYDDQGIYIFSRMY